MTSPQNLKAAPRLEPVAPNIWIVEGGIVGFYSFPYPTRSVIVRLPHGELWVWSPIALDEALRKEVAAQGDVAHLVSPNPIHHLFLGEWKRAFPNARFWGPTQTIRKRRDLAFEAPLTGAPPQAWADAIDQAWFRGSLLMDEIVFFHGPSATAIFADLSENFSESFLKTYWPWWARPIARMWRIVEGWGYAPLEWRVSWTKRRLARAALAKVLAWNPDRVIMAHGEWQREGGRAYIERAFRWLT